MSLLTNPILAKLLAKENVEVRHGNFRTAWFDVENRVLGLPLWKDYGKDVYDLLVGHEVGHALFTPSEGWHESNEEIKGCPRGYLNVVEDVRIERKIRETYPGLISPMRRGYKVLVEKGFFGELDDYDMDQLKLIDKINLKSKLGDAIDVPFNAEEQSLMDRALVAETWSEVVQIARDILAYTESLKETRIELPVPAEDGDENDEDGNQSANRSISGTPEEDGDEDADPSGQSESDDLGDTASDEETEGETRFNNPNPIYDEEEPDVSITDEIFRSKEAELLEVDEAGEQPIYIRELTKEAISHAVVPYKKLQEMREAVRNDPIAYKFSDAEDALELRVNFNKYYKDVKRAIVPAVKEFEMRKAAYQYQRSASAKTGSIDVNKVHSYRYNEDIFKKVTIQADAKNHGMFLLVDFSGSMYETISNALDQVTHLVAFCKSINIPFEVYAFTSTNTNPRSDFQEGTMRMDGLYLTQLTSSTLKKRDFEDSMYNIWLRQYMHSRDGDIALRNHNINMYNIVSAAEEFGSTPLHQALTVSHYLVKNMIQKNNIEKMNVVTLTDGDSNQLHTFIKSTGDNTPPLQYGSRREYMITIDKKLVRVPASRRRSAVSEAILKNMAKTLGTTNIGFFIASSARSMHWQASTATQNIPGKSAYDYDKKAAAAEFKKNRCIDIQNAFGYSQYYILRSGSDLSTAEDDGFESVDSNASKGKMMTEFKKFSKSKKTNKVLMTKFGKAVA